MNEEQLAKVPAIDRLEADVDDWQQQLQQVRAAIDYAETNQDPDGLVAARKSIADILTEMENTRRYITVRRSYLASVTSDASTWFGDQSVVPQANPSPQDAHNAG